MIRALIQQCHGVEEPQKYPRMSSKCPSLCVNKRTVLTTGFVYASQRKKSIGAVYVTCIILSVTSPSLSRYLFIYVQANLYSVSGMASAYISGTVPTFYIPGARLSLGLLAIPITVNGSCTCPPGRQRPFNLLVPCLLVSQKLIFYSREK